MMLVETLSTFPEMFDSVMGSSMMKRAQDKKILEFKAHNLRDWTHDFHKTTDDDPYGGGSGLVMKCEPIFEAMDEIVPADSRLPHVVFLSPAGRVFDDTLASELAKKQRLIFVCGHYEGIDERAYTLADTTISLGDYVLTSGELASMVVIDAVVRKIDGVLGASDGAQNESFVEGLLEYPQYTRPFEYRGMEVPEVLRSGNHAKIDEWRRHKSLETTLRARPDLIKQLMEENALSKNDINFLKSLKSFSDFKQ